MYALSSNAIGFLVNISVWKVNIKKCGMFSIDNVFAIINFMSVCYQRPRGGILIVLECHATSLQVCILQVSPS